jgi:hypothetical protein
MPCVVRRPFEALLVASSVALALAAAAGAGNGGFAPQPPASPNASRITDADWFIVALAASPPPPENFTQPLPYVSSARPLRDLRLRLKEKEALGSAVT